MRPIRSDARALDVAGVGDGHYHVFFLNEVFDVDLGLSGDDFGSAVGSIASAHILKLVDDELHQQLFTREDGG